MENETFFTLLQDPAHWEFELFLVFVFDVLIGVVIWPRIQKLLKHHTSDDQKIEALARELKRLKEENSLR